MPHHATQFADWLNFHSNRSWKENLAPLCVQCHPSRPLSIFRTLSPFRWTLSPCAHGTLGRTGGSYIYTHRERYRTTLSRQVVCDSDTTWKGTGARQTYKVMTNNDWDGRLWGSCFVRWHIYSRGVFLVSIREPIASHMYLSTTTSHGYVE
jgi:hypothetical protein